MKSASTIDFSRHFNSNISVATGLISSINVLTDDFPFAEEHLILKPFLLIFSQIPNGTKIQKKISLTDFFFQILVSL